MIRQHKRKPKNKFQPEKLLEGLEHFFAGTLRNFLSIEDKKKKYKKIYNVYKV